MKPAFAAAVALSLFMAGPAHAASEPTAAGFWEQSDNGVAGGWFFFSEKDGFFEGRLVKMFAKPGEPPHDFCTKCTGDLKDAPMLGLKMVTGMKREGLKYKDGSILDPRNGTVYHALMELSPDGQELTVRGYLGIPLLGRSQVWLRVPDDAVAAANIPPEIEGLDPVPKDIPPKDALPKDAKPKDASPKDVSPADVKPKAPSPKASPTDALPKDVKPKDPSPKASPKGVSPTDASPKDGKPKDAPTKDKDAKPKDASTKGKDAKPKNVQTPAATPTVNP